MRHMNAMLKLELDAGLGSLIKGLRSRTGACAAGKSDPLSVYLVQLGRLALLLCLVLAAASIGAAAPANYPVFSWERVPVAADFRTDHAMTPEEVAFIARHYAFISLEKGQGRKSLPQGQQYTEDGFVAATKALKSQNPAIKVLFYWNSTFHYPLYRASAAFRPEWCIRARDGANLECRRDGRNRIRYDRGNPEFRDWWANTAAQAVRAAGADGIFVDAVGKANPAPLLQMIGMVSAQLKPLGRDLVLFNDVPGQDPAAPGNPLLEATAGFMIEDFDRKGNTSPENLKRDLLTVMEAGRRGKIVLFKAWPGFSFLDKAEIATPYEARVARARANILFPLACFLAAAQPYAYFQYSWSFAEPGGGNLIYRANGQLDETWYPELLKPLGPPKGTAQINGYVVTREFRNAGVSCDAQSKTGRITWK